MLCCDTARRRHSRRLACLCSHVLRAYCNFELKQANLGDAEIIRSLPETKNVMITWHVVSIIAENKPHAHH